MKAIGFVGQSGSGKTTLIERLIPLFARTGLIVSAVKHAHHGFDIDRPGKDSYRYRAAGAAQVMIAAPERWALMTELHEQAAGLDSLLRQLAPCDLVLVEGFRTEGSMPRIEVRGATEQGPSTLALDANVIAVVCDQAADRALPRFARDDVISIRDFIAARLELT